MRFYSYFNNAVRIVTEYDGKVPLAAFLKQYFAQDKKYGSKDRKFITHLCYCYFRLGHALKELTVEERLKTALFLSNDSVEDWKVLYDDEWLQHSNENIYLRIAFIQTKYDFDVTAIFPWQDQLSEGIDVEKFCLSHLIQPNLFLRIRPGKKKSVIEKLEKANISFSEKNENCLSLKNTTKVDEVLQLNKEVVVQDCSSQRIKEFFEEVNADNKKHVNVWDCCAASGGKAILAVDSFQNISLTVSDIRSSIIHNLEKRFKEAGIKKYDSFTADLTKSYLSHSKYDLVIADVPCSGSGTWSRTPEQLFFFPEEKIKYYSTLQRSILPNIVPAVEKKGYLLYITCSVFKEENEEMINLLQQQFHLQLIKMKLLKGYDDKADTMFAALLKKM
ncbi:MAG: Fmu (Sun) domain-containing protein [Ilyomonas sp.]